MPMSDYKHALVRGQRQAQGSRDLYGPKVPWPDGTIYDTMFIPPV